MNTDCIHLRLHTVFACYCWIQSYETHLRRPTFSPATGQGVVSTLNQRHWRWFNVDTTPCARWDRDTKKYRLNIRLLHGELANVGPMFSNHASDLLLFVVSRMFPLIPKLFYFDTSILGHKKVAVIFEDVSGISVGDDSCICHSGHQWTILGQITHLIDAATNRQFREVFLRQHWSLPLTIPHIKRSE